MLRSLTSAGTGMVAQQMNLDTIANNLANVNTTGYKAQRAEFQDLMYQTYRASGASGQGGSQPVAMQVGLGSQFSSTNTNFSIGGPQQTGKSTDMMIMGDGFFQVTMPDGTTGYTRDGSFKLDQDGTLVTSSGYRVAGDIKIEPGSTGLTVSPDGVVSAMAPGSNDPAEVGKIEVALFANPGGLSRIGENLYSAGGASGDAQVTTPGTGGAGKIQAGALETSNVQVVEEMVRMITAQRAYEINSKAIQTADDMLAQLNQLKR